MHRTTRCCPMLRCLLLLCALALLPAGCTILGGGGGPLRLAAEDGSAELPTTFTYAAYSVKDANSADLYLTDLAPEDRLGDGDLSGAAGQFLHVQIFLDPEAGQTPLDPTSCNIVVRHLVVVGNDLGLYGGGGFMPLSGTPGDETLSGNVRGATLRLLGATPAFDDRLGNCELVGGVSATHDEEAARKLAREFDALARRIPGVR